jgi:hypothetical protein
MEKSKHYKDVLALGRLLVKELDLEQSVDTLGRWMAHHISELIVEAEKTEGSDKSDVEDRCREAVLALWNHIRVFPRGHRPLENIELLLATIQALDPENQAYFYQSEAQSQIEQSTLSDRAKNWLELSRGIDYSARLLINMCLKNAANEITEEKRDLLELARSLDADTPITSIARILIDEREKSDEEQKAEVIREAIKTLKSRRERLRKMVEMSELLASSIDDDIKNMEQSLDE